MAKVTFLPNNRSAYTFETQKDYTHVYILAYAGVSSLGRPYVPWRWNTQILAEKLTKGTDYAHLNTTGTLGFSDLLTALLCKLRTYVQWCA